MKKLFILLFCIASFRAFAQIDSAQTPQTFIVKRGHMGFMKSCISSNYEPHLITLWAQVSKQVTPVFNYNQPITVTTESSTVVQVFRVMGKQYDWYSNAINDSIQAEISPFITNPWLGRQLLQIKEHNEAEALRRAKQGDAFFVATKPNDD